VIGTAIDPKLIPRNHDGSEQVWARGPWCVIYHHPDDAYALPIFNNVSFEFIADYIQARPTFFLSTVSGDWKWEILPALVPEGAA
jgi:hypothetical protein